MPLRDDDDSKPDIIHRELPNAVTYDLSRPGQVRITLPRGSTWSSGLHWHESHTEYLQVLQGSIKVHFGDTYTILSAENLSHRRHAEGGGDVGSSKPELRIDRYQWHAWERATTDGGEDVVVLERTDPADGDKTVFFRNVNGVILHTPRLPGSSIIPWIIPWKSTRATIQDAWLTLNLLVVFHYLDNYPVFVDFPAMWGASLAPVLRGYLAVLDRVVSQIILHLAAWFGWFLDVRPVRLAYTPAIEYAEWMSRHVHGTSKTS